MAYIKQTWIDDETPITADKMNHIEDGIGEVEASLTRQISLINGGTPTPVSSASAMTDTSAIYLYVGSETGYTAGDWYYYDGSEWVSGGTYGSGSMLTRTQWRNIISLFRAAIYDSSVLANPQTIIDELEDSYNNIPSTGITLSSNSLTFLTVDAQTVVATLIPSNTTDEITAVSSNTSIVTVSVNNKNVIITPVANGTATITVTTDSGLSQTVSVEVDMPQTFSITNTLTGCTNSNTQSIVTEGSTYHAVLNLADPSYTFSSVSVLMGETNITATAWDSSTREINIASVSDDISITAIATSPVLYSLSSPLITDGTANNYINTNVLLADEDKSYSIVVYIKFAVAASSVGSNKYIIHSGDASNSGVSRYIRTMAYGVVTNEVGTSKTPKNYNNKQNCKVVLTHEAGTNIYKTSLKYFDQVNGPTSDDRTFTATRTVEFVAHTNPVYIGKRVDNYGICDNMTIETVKIFNYALSDEDVATYIATESAEV